jgi:hypothetical protein
MPMTNGCYFCGLPVDDFEPIYCCGGQDCGCQGMPIDPPMHDDCVTIDFLKKVKDFSAKAKEQNISIGMCRSFPGKEAKLENHRHLISSEDITVAEAQYVMDCQGTSLRLAEIADSLIEKLGGGSVEENSEEKPEKVKKRWEILDL